MARLRPRLSVAGVVPHSLFLVFLGATIHPRAVAQIPVLLKDINMQSPVSTSSSPTDGVPFGPWTYFAASASATGRELYRTGSSPGSTELVADLVPGPGSSWPIDLTVFDHRIWFGVSFLGAERGLWVTDGTAAGTSRLKAFAAAPEKLTVLGEELFFVASATVVSDTELWKTDGTPAGTVRVADIHAGPFSSGIDELTPWQGRLYFTAGDAIHGSELWVSDGTTPGTYMVRDILPGTGTGVGYGLSPHRLFTPLGSRLYFVAQSSPGNREVWSTDGTEAGTTVLLEVGPGAVGGISGETSIFEVGGALYFVANDGIHGVELWTSDGTAAGTRLVADINPGSATGAFFPFAVLNGELFFSGSDPARGTEPWRSDGTVAGTRLIADLNPGTGHGIPPLILGSSGSLLPQSLGAMVVFEGDDGTRGREPWVTDGIGVTPLADIRPGPQGSSAQSLSLDGSGTRLLFTADDGLIGVELYGTDGTPAGTGLWDDIFPSPPETVGSDAQLMADLFGRVVSRPMTAWSASSLRLRARVRG